MGYHWTVEADTKDALPVTAWWNRKVLLEKDKPKKTVEFLILRQEGLEGESADVIVLSPAQVYDLIHALNRAVERF